MGEIRPRYGRDMGEIRAGWFVTVAYRRSIHHEPLVELEGDLVRRCGDRAEIVRRSRRDRAEIGPRSRGDRAEIAPRSHLGLEIPLSNDSIWARTEVLIGRIQIVTARQVLAYRRGVDVVDLRHVSEWARLPN